MEACVIFLELARMDIVGLTLAGIVELRAVLVPIGVAMLTSERVLLPELLG